MKAWRSLLLVAAFIACVPFTASADDVVVAQINGVDIKQSDLDFAASEVGAQLANFPPEDRRRKTRTLKALIFEGLLAR